MKRIKNGFTLVELLIVIALIAILSVAVLATINPIEQTNKARDSRVQNDAAEVLNAYERYYASKQAYPWEEFTGTGKFASGAAAVLRSDTYGFGICSDQNSYETLIGQSPIAKTVGSCSSGTYTNALIQSSELKNSFIGKDEFEPVRAAVSGTAPLSQAMWMVRAASSDSLYLCYVPKANANRTDTTKMRCITTAGVVQKITTGSCALAAAADYSADPQSFILAAPISAVFRCIPE